MITKGMPGGWTVWFEDIFCHFKLLLYINPELKSEVCDGSIKLDCLGFNHIVLKTLVPWFSKIRGVGSPSEWVKRKVPIHPVCFMDKRAFLLSGVRGEFCNLATLGNRIGVLQLFSLMKMKSALEWKF